MNVGEASVRCFAALHRNHILFRKRYQLENVGLFNARSGESERMSEMLEESKKSRRALTKIEQALREYGRLEFTICSQATDLLESNLILAYELSQIPKPPAYSDSGARITIWRWINSHPNTPDMNLEMQPFWSSYKLDIKKLLTSPSFHTYLSVDIRRLWHVDEELPAECSTIVQTQGPPTEAEMEAGLIGTSGANPTHRQRWQDSLKIFFHVAWDITYIGSAVVVWTINISSALGYIMLVHASASDKVKSTLPSPSSSQPYLLL